MVRQQTQGCARAPKYSKIDIVFQRTSLENDSNVICGCAAAFTDKQGNPEGWNVSNGIKVGRFWNERGGFAFYNHQWLFCPSDTYSNVTDTATQYSGMAFQQEMIIFHGGIVYKGPHKNKTNIYRALCEYKNQLIIIETKKAISMEFFIQCLLAYGVDNAIYLDMGGWRYSWYRDIHNTIVRNHIQTKNANYSNWLVFYK